MTREQAKRIALKHCRPFLMPFDRWILPVIASMNHHANIADIMSVQPMSEPSGEMFYLDFRRDSWWEKFKRWVRWHLLVRTRRKVCRRCPPLDEWPRR